MPPGGQPDEPPRKQLKMSMSPPASPAVSMASTGSSHPFSALSQSPPGSSRISLDSALRAKHSGPVYGNHAPQASTSLGGFGNKAPKKLVLKTNRARPASSSSTQDFTNASLQTLVRAARAVLSSPPEPTSESLQALYSLCEGVVGTGSTTDSKHSATAQTLYDRIRIEIERKVGENATTLRQLDATDKALWLEALASTWNSYTAKLLLVRSIFLHLDRTYVLQMPNLLSLWDTGLDVFRRRIVEDQSIGGTMTTALLKLVYNERDGEAVPHALLSGTIGMLTTISATAHVNCFVTPFLASSTRYYDREGQGLLAQEGDAQAADVDAESKAALTPISTIWDYLAHVKTRLSEEGKRCDNVLGADVKAPMLRVVEQSLVGAHTATIISRGLGSMFEEKRIAELGVMYNLLSRVDALTMLKKEYGEYVKAKGTAIVSDSSRDDTMVDSLITFQSTIDSVNKDAFEHDLEMDRVSREAFVSFINSRQNKPAEMIAKFIDQKMKLGNKAMSDDDLDKVFMQVLRLFRYCQGKDIFEAFYKKDFAKRLLLNRSASSDAEKGMLLKLKEECGAVFTANLETMAKDIDLSNDIMKSYKEFLDPEIRSVLAVNILTTGNWPTYRQQPCNVPDDLQKELQRFTVFYKAKYAGRSLSWMHSLDTCTLKVEFDKGAGGGRKELNVSFHQAIILLVFNDKAADEQVSYKDIVALTGLDHTEAQRTLQSLACAKYKILSKHPKGREVSDSDSFSFNAGFKDDKYRLKINQIQQKETPEEAKETTQRVLLDRQTHAQLLIVRLLKSRKTMKHQALVMEVSATLGARFKIDPPEIKKAIDTLIDQEYMEREGRDTYNYVA